MDTTLKIIILKSLLISSCFVFCMLIVPFPVVGMLEICGVDDRALFHSLSSIVAGGVSVSVLSQLSFIRWRKAFSPASYSFPWALKVILSSLLVIFGLNLLIERLDLPDNNIQIMDDMAHSPLGFFALVVMAPLVEELVFREAMIRMFLQNHVRPWIPVLVSSLAFGIVHANPAQIPFATVMGILFGCLYVRTQSILLGLVLHILNNAMAVLLLLFWGKDASLTDFFPGDVSLLLTSVLGLFLGFWCVHRLMRQMR